MGAFCAGSGHAAWPVACNDVLRRADGSTGREHEPKREDIAKARVASMRLPRDRCRVCA